MRLRKIKLAGFKSFVDPTTITLPGNLIGVVGPNGCGKSNVIDAVRWVMGESSAKQLRGESLVDVIFNGSSARKPVGHASIELAFDNTDGRLGGQYADYSEIAIRRQLSRDGQSNYYLNGTKCRRRDITDIFLGTGLGPRSYAIIEQGTISRLIEAKPEELRMFLEEAAGISKYKERRRETTNRIKHTRENINRINDIIDEIEKRLQTLQRQAKAAEKYKDLKQHERLVKAQLVALRWQHINQTITEHDKNIASSETGLEAQIADLRAVELSIEKQREGYAEANEAFNKVQGQLYSVGADIARIEQAIQHTAEKRQRNQQDLEQVEQSLTEAGVHLANDLSQLKGLEQALCDCEPDISQAQEHERISSQALTETEDSMQVWQKEWEGFNKEAADNLQDAEVARTRITHLENHLLRLEERRQRLVAEQQDIPAKSLKDEAASLDEQVTEQNRISTNVRSELDALINNIAQQRDQNSQLNQQIQTERARLQELQKQHAALEALQHVALGKQEQAVTTWLKQNDMQKLSRLAERIEVDSGWECAVETVLGLNLEAICVNGLDKFAAKLGSLKQGSLAVYDTQTSAGASPMRDIAPSLHDKIKAEWQMDSLFDGVYAVKTLKDALALRGKLKAHETVITKDGIWMGHGWLRVIRDADEKSGVLAREQELKQTIVDLDASTAELVVLEQLLQTGEDSLKSFENERESLQTKLNDSIQRYTELRAQTSGKTAKLEELESRHEHLLDEINELTEQAETENEELTKARLQLESAIEKTTEYEQQRKELITSRDTLTQTMEACRDRARQDRDHAREIVLNKQSLGAQLSSIKESHERAQNQSLQQQKRREELTEALAEGDQPIESLKKELEKFLASRLQVESELGEARKKVENCEHKLRELNENRSDAELKVQHHRNELEQMRLAWQELNVRRQTLTEQIDETSYTLETLLEELPEAANESDWQGQVSTVEQRIQRLGAINLAAIEEFTEQSERKEYLDAQYKDLNDALETLENAIRKIDQETRSRFKDTFDLVNDKLQQLFPKLFGGGIAYLEMTSDDPLETGISIMARPPGKRNSNIHLLSGGEKALTAVALIFAIFELNPAPFCLLDEVDAPLDDTNAARFCKMVTEMSERVQFVFITHNKITMEMAHQLIGVTMQEAGVSRLVAVDVDEAVELIAV